MLPQIERTGGALTPRFMTPERLVPMPSKSSIICSVDGCEDSVRVRGWCNRHYLRWYRHGDPLAGGVSLNCRSSNPVDRFWSSVDKSGLSLDYERAENPGIRLTFVRVDDEESL